MNNKRNKVKKAPSPNNDIQSYYDESNSPFEESKSSVGSYDIVKPLQYKNSTKIDFTKAQNLRTEESQNHGDNSQLELIDAFNDDQFEAEVAFELANKKYKKQQREDRRKKKQDVQKITAEPSSYEYTQNGQSTSQLRPQTSNTELPPISSTMTSQVQMRDMRDMDHTKIDNKDMRSIKGKLAVHEQRQQQIQNHLQDSNQNNDYGKVGLKFDAQNTYNKNAKNTAMVPFDSNPRKSSETNDQKVVKLPERPASQQTKIPTAKSTIQNSRTPSVPPEERALTAAELKEVDNWNKVPQDKLGGKMSLHDLNKQKLDARVIKQLVNKALTTRYLKELGEIKDTEVDLSDDEKKIIAQKKQGQMSKSTNEMFGVNQETDKSLNSNQKGFQNLKKGKTFFSIENEKNTNEDSEFRPKDKNQSYNKEIFIKKYGVKVQLPAFYIQDAKCYPQNIRYCLKVVKYSIPSKNMEVNIYNHNQPTIESDMVEIFKDPLYQKENVVLELMECTKDDKSLKVIKQVPIIDAYMVNMAFSPDGKYFALFRLKRNILQIYKIDNQNIIGLLDKVQKQQCFKQFTKIPALKSSQTMYFDLESRYLASYGKDMVNIISLFDVSKKIETTIVDNKYNVLDLQLVSNKDNSYRCDIAVHLRCSANIYVYTIGREVDEKRCFSISGLSNSHHCDALTKSILKISRDFKKIVLSFSDQNYTLDEDVIFGYKQQFIPQLLNKKVNKIYQIDSEFFFICFTDYDSNFKVISLSKPDFDMRIPKKCEPGKLFALDVAQTEIKNGFGTRMVILDIRDEEFFYEVIKPQERMKYVKSHGSNKQKVQERKVKMIDDENLVAAGLKTQRDEIKSARDQVEGTFYESILYNPVQGYSAMWPYIVFSGLGNSMWVYCAFNPNQFKKITSPNKDPDFLFKKYFMTKDLILYFILENIEKEKRQVWMLDFKKPRGFTDFRKQIIQLELCFEYSFESVDNMPLMDFFVRSESRADSQNEKNLRLMIFIIHKGTLYSWIQGDKQLKAVCKTGSEKIIRINKNEIIINNDMTCQAKCTTCPFTFRILKLKMVFSFYHLTTIYEEKMPIGDILKAFSLDPCTMILITMHKSLKEKHNNSRRYKFTDLSDSNKVLANIQVKNKEIIGRFTLGMFTLADGHFYFDNEVIKIRYDLLKKPQVQKLTENQVFDNYEGLLAVKKGEVVQSNNPYLDNTSNRMIYYTRNPVALTPKKVLMLPFLHERKVYLNRMKEGNSYFYTVIEENIDNIHDDIIPFDMKQGSKDKIQMIVSLDFTRNVYFIYSMSGILLNKVYFEEQVKQYGQVVQISENGKNMIFMDPNDQFKIHLLCLNSYKLVYMKSIQIKEDILDYICEIEKFQIGTAEHDYAKELRKKIQVDYADYFIESSALCSFGINDNLDITVQISNQIEQDLYNQLTETFNSDDIQLLQKIFKFENKKIMLSIKQKKTKKQIQEANELDRQIQKYRDLLSLDTKMILKDLKPQIYMNVKNSVLQFKGSIFYVQKGSHKMNVLGKPLSKLQKSFIKKRLEKDQANDKEANRQKASKEMDLQALFFTIEFEEFFIPGQEIDKFEINQQYLIFWSFQGVFYINLKATRDVKMNFVKLGVIVDPEEKNSFIQRVRCGSDSRYIMIVVRQTPQSNCMILWDIEQNQEVQSFDQSRESIVFYGCDGDAYITDGDSVTITEQNVQLKSFDVKAIKDSDNNQFDYFKGHRFDNINHNWILFNEYISTSFSYMTLVIRDESQKAETIQDENFVFDAEQFNFIINRTTCFTCDNFVGSDYDKLSFILQKMKEVDPILLQQLHYYFEYDPSIEQFDNQDEDQKSVAKEQKPVAKESKRRSSIGALISQRLGGKNEEKEQKRSKITPLHLAYKEGNNRCINLILLYMSMINQNCSETISDILHKLVECENFGIYMAELPYQTVQMLNKQTLRLKSKFNDHIVAVNRSQSSYCDDYYYRTTMHEQPPADESALKQWAVGQNLKKEATNYPVQVWAYKVHWILNTEDGNKLLQKILKSEKIELFECPAIEVIIEFYYIYFRDKVMKFRLPVYLFQLIVYFAAIMLNEYGQLSPDVRNTINNNIITELLEEDGIEGEPEVWNQQLGLDDIDLAHESYASDKESLQYWINFASFVALMNLGLTLYSIFMVFLQAKDSYKTYFITVWAYLDIAYCVINGLISITLLGDEILSIEQLRQVEAILSIIIIGKLIYFTQLMDEIAPLINIIIKIFIDIGWFMIVFILIMACFSISFYLIGQNQTKEIHYEFRKDFISQLMSLFGDEEATKAYIYEMGNEDLHEDPELPSYHYYDGALSHVYLLAFGDFDTDSYGMGDGSQGFILWCFFLLASFVLCLHLLNMLIAIMGETFGSNNEVKRMSQIKSHLRFVLDNFYLDAIENKGNVTYLITAFLSSEDNEDNGALNELKGAISQLLINQKKDNDKIMQELQAIKTQNESMQQM